MPKSTKSRTKPPATSGDSLETIYSHLSQLLAKHAPPFRLNDLAVRNKKSIELTVPKPVVIPGAYGGKPVHLQMAAAILQKGYVGFYLMCIYMNDDARKQISPALLKTLKGKTCFHLKKWDDSIAKDIEAALTLGTKLYISRGWL